MAALESLLLTLPVAAKARGDAFERLVKWYLENSPTYSALIERVWRWGDWPGRWGVDAGIDLVAETHDDELWAIQSKAYGATTTISKADVDTFLSESARDVFHFRLLIATTDQIGRNARQVFSGQAIPASLRLLSDLAAEPLEWPSSVDDLDAPQRPPSLPRPHQIEALDAIELRLADGGRGRIVMACGTGKTFVQLWAHERLNSQRTLVLVPSLFLVQQSLNEWTANRTRPFEFLAVCSDDTVMPDGFASDVTELGLPVTTDPARIRQFLESSGDRVIFSTYQSSAQIAEAMRGTVIRFDLVLADEAHRLAGAGSRDFTSVLRDDAIPADRRIFFTATPRYLTGKTLGNGEASDLEVVSMDDETVFGPEIHTLNFGEAIQRELLSDYRVVVVGVSDQDAHRLAEQGAFVTFEGKTIDARSLAREIGLAKAMHDFSLRRVISFHSRVKAARDFSIALRDLIPRLPVEQSPQGDLLFDHVSGQMPTGDRRRRISRLRDVRGDQYALLANARCLSEGVDVPSIDGVAFIDPRRSQVDILQAVGRAIRLSPEKTLGTIVIPVLIPDGEDAEHVLSDSAFEPVWAVVRALRDYDTDLAEELDAARRKLGLEGTLTERDLPPRIILDLPIGTVGLAFLNAFTAMVVKRTTSNWEDGFAYLQQFVAREGDARVPDGFTTVNGYGLGTWVGSQRSAYRRRAIPSERKSRLEALTGWTWDARAADWEDGFQHLMAFFSREGHARVPAQLVTADGHRLGQWITVQRSMRRRGLMEPARISRLETIAGWDWDPLRADWDRGLACLLAFIDREGHALVPPKFHAHDGYPLGTWVGKQRAVYRRGKLPAARVHRLDAVRGWSWDVIATQWLHTFSRLQAFAEREGHARVPRDFATDDGLRLGEWVKNQRTKRSRSGMSDAHVSQLESLPGWTWEFPDAWEEGFSQLLAFSEREGHTRVPHDFTASDGRSLGTWVVKQRAVYGRGALSPQRVARLEAVEAWLWDTRRDRWENGYSHLQLFVRHEGHARVPAKFKSSDGFALGSWVNRQRTTRDGMTSEQTALLEGIPGWTWAPFDGDWEDGFSHLQAFVSDHGHARVTSGFKTDDGYSLGAWVNSARTSRNSMDPVRAARLDNVKGWSWAPLADRWDVGFAHLKSFVSEAGHTRVPQNFKTPDAFRLGGWVSKKRAQYAAGSLSVERATSLEALPGWVWRG